MNGIRKYFAGRPGVPFEEEFRVRVLPRSTFQPRYWEPSYFLWAVMAFSILNAVYLGVGVFLWFTLDESTCIVPWLAGLISFAGFSLVNVAAYALLGRYRETRYLRSHIIAVDIDGVLNRHREHFCKMLSQLCGKVLDPETIAHIPVHECTGLKDANGGAVAVTEAEEHAVFNHPAYWRDMPADAGTPSVLGKLKNILRYRIFVFTHRPWPHPTTFPNGKDEQYKLLWQSVSTRWQRGSAAIRGITEAWLRRHNFPFDKLIIETGNIHTTEPRLLVRNRFVISERKRIRIFVEDDLFKAKKLAHICEVVFLLDHPYNQCEQSDLPNNVIRVKSWREIYEYVREVL